MLSSEQRREFAVNGYLVVPDLVPRSSAAAMLIAARAFAKEKLAEKADIESPTARYEKYIVYNALQVPIIGEILEIPLFIELACGLLGRSHFKYNGDALISLPSGEDISIWHRDPIFSLMDTQQTTDPVEDRVHLDAISRQHSSDALSHESLVHANLCRLQLTVSIHLHDVNEESGPLRVLPGSHRWEQRHSNVQTPCVFDQRPQDGEKYLTGSQGTVVFHESALWHTASPNRSDHDCQMLLIDVVPKLPYEELRRKKLIDSRYFWLS